MNRRFVRETRVGALILVAFVVLIVAIFSVGQQQKVFGEKVRYKILFPDINGLHKGDAVMLNGLNVGYVDKIQFPQDVTQQRVEVVILVQKAVMNRIRTDSRARITSLSLVTTRFVSISMGSATARPLPPGSYIPVAKAAGYQEVLSNSDQMIDHIDQVAVELRQILQQISDGSGFLGSLITRPNPQLTATIQNLNAASADLAAVARGIRQGQGALGYMLKDTVGIRRAVWNLQQASRHLNDMTKKMQSSQSLLGKMLSDSTYGRQVSKNLAEVLKNLKNITAKIDTGKGTLGALVNDPEMYWALRDAVYGVETNRFLRWFLPKARRDGAHIRTKMKERTGNP